MPAAKIERRGARHRFGSLIRKSARPERMACATSSPVGRDWLLPKRDLRERYRRASSSETRSSWAPAPAGRCAMRARRDAQEAISVSADKRIAVANEMPCSRWRTQVTTASCSPCVSAMVSAFALSSSPSETVQMDAAATTSPRGGDATLPASFKGSASAAEAFAQRQSNNGSWLPPTIGGATKGVPARATGAISPAVTSNQRRTRKNQRPITLVQGTSPFCNEFDKRSCSDNRRQSPLRPGRQKVWHLHLYANDCKFIGN